MKHLDRWMKFHSNLTHEKYRIKTVQILAHPAPEQPGKLFPTAIGLMCLIIRVGRHDLLAR
jgi:hypothetical protein